MQPMSKRRNFNSTKIIGMYICVFSSFTKFLNQDTN